MGAFDNTMESFPHSIYRAGKLVRYVAGSENWRSFVPPTQDPSWFRTGFPFKPMGSFAAHVASTVQLALTTIAAPAGWLDSPTNHMETSDQA